MGLCTPVLYCHPVRGPQSLVSSGVREEATLSISCSHPIPVPKKGGPVPAQKPHTLCPLWIGGPQDSRVPAETLLLICENCVLHMSLPSCSTSKFGSGVVLDRCGLGAFDPRHSVVCVFKALTIPVWVGQKALGLVLALASFSVKC